MRSVDEKLAWRSGVDEGRWMPHSPPPPTPLGGAESNDDDAEALYGDSSVVGGNVYDASDDELCGVYLLHV